MFTVSIGLWFEILDETNLEYWVLTSLIWTLGPKLWMDLSAHIGIVYFLKQKHSEQIYPHLIGVKIHVYGANNEQWKIPQNRIEFSSRMMTVLQHLSSFAKLRKTLSSTPKSTCLLGLTKIAKFLKSLLSRTSECLMNKGKKVTHCQSSRACLG